MKTARLLGIALLCLWMGAVAQAQVAVPPFQAYVTDLTATLGPPERAELESRLAAIAQQSGSQVAVLMVPTTRPEDLAAYAIRVADAWKLGRKGVDDGVILIVAVQDRSLRIEVGRGLEGAIPDAIAKRIIAETIAPRFKRGDFHAGLAAGVERIAERIGAEALPPPDRKAPSGDGVFSWLPIIVFVVFILLTMLRGRRRSSYYASRGISGRDVATGMILDAVLRGMSGRGGGGGGGGWSGGGGGGFGGGGASGDW